MELRRILGIKGRTTIPFEIRQKLGFRYNDVITFTVADDNTVIVRKEKICDNCRLAVPPLKEPDELDTVTLEEFLDSLSPSEQRAALIHLSVKWASTKAGVKG